MKLARTLLLLALFVVPACAAAADDPRFPPGPFVPAPMPSPLPAPDAPVRLAKGKYYVVRSNEPLLVLQTAGTGAVSVHERDGAKKPLTIPAEWAVGWQPDPADPEFVTFTDPHLYVVKAKAAGPVTLLVVPALKAGADGKAVPLAKSDLVFKTFDVEGDVGPVVPPGPSPPGPNPPGPQPPAPEPAKTFRVILVYESGDTPTPAQQAVLYGKAVEDYLTGRCTGGKEGWGRRDKDADPAADTTGLKDLWSAVKPKVTTTPALAIAVNEKVTLEPLPATPADAVALLKKYAGDK